MRNRLPACSFQLTLLMVLPLATCCAVAEADDRPTTLNRSYIDDDDQRRLADLQFSVDQATGRSLRISIRAIGPDVEPIGGFRGIQGSNRYTAEELDLVLRGRHESVVLTRTETGDLIEGRITAGEFGRLTERRVIASGEIDFQHQSGLLPLSIHVDTSSSSSDWLQTSVIIDGQPRLSCRYRIRNGVIVDLQTESLGHDGYIAVEGPDEKRRNRWFTAAADEVTSPVEKSEWEKRDIEGRWVLMMSQLDEDPAAISNWVAWLAQEKQFELLEWLAIYQADAFKSHGVGKALLAADAPGWIRIAAWHRNSSPYMGHGRQQAGQMLLEANPAVVEDWITTHRENLDNWEPSLNSLYGQLGSDDIAAKDSSSYDGPFQPKEVFALLESPQKVAVFGDRLQAEAGVVYEHQVVRVIRAVAISGRRSDQRKQEIGKLIDHSSERIRIEAMLAHSFLLPESSGERPNRFLQIVDDESESAAVRQAALLGVSYQDHPSLILKLHTVAGEPDHPAWKSAISRIGDLGRGYSMIILNSLAADQLDQTQAELLKDALKRIAERELKRRDGAYQVAELIRLASIAKAENHVHSDLIFDWVKSSGKSLDPKSLGQLKAKYSVEQLEGVRPIWAADSGTKWHPLYADLLKDIISKERG
ncbi:MAG: hypothetical protein ABJZ55_23360 [Fuerstiella sp.]